MTQKLCYDCLMINYMDFKMNLENIKVLFAWNRNKFGISDTTPKFEISQEDWDQFLKFINQDARNFVSHMSSHGWDIFICEKEIIIASPHLGNKGWIFGFGEEFFPYPNRRLDTDIWNHIYAGGKNTVLTQKWEIE